MNITNSNFLLNKGHFGGAIYLSMVKNLLLVSNDFERNYATSAGGGMYLSGTGGRYTYSDRSQFSSANNTFKENNVSQGNGGASGNWQFEGGAAIIEKTDYTEENNTYISKPLS